MSPYPEVQMVFKATLRTPSPIAMGTSETWRCKHEHRTYLAALECAKRKRRKKKP